MRLPVPQMEERFTDPFAACIQIPAVLSTHVVLRWPSSMPCSLVSYGKILGASWTMALVLAVAGMCLYTRHNDFDFYLHPDESGKVKQVLKNKRNFNHPLMLITVSRWIHKLDGGKRDLARIAIAGRTASALFSTGAVVALALLGRRLGRASGFRGAEIAAGWAVGVFLLMSPLMFELAHYMKEDPSLALGVALVMLSLHIFWEKRDLHSLLLAGAAMGTAASGKYMGWLLLPFAVGIVFAAPTPNLSWLRRVGFFLLAGAGVWAIFNYSIFKNPAAALASLNRETQGAVGGHRGVTQDVPHDHYVQLFLGTPVALRFLCGTFIATLLVRRRSITPPEWLLVVFPVVLFLLMSFSPKSSTRYYLPVDMLVYFSAGVGAVWSAGWIREWTSKFGRRDGQYVGAIVTVVLIAWVVWSAQPGLARTFTSFAHDDRDDLKTWITESLPLTAVIAQDDRINLPTADRWEYEGKPLLKQRILREEFVADLGTVPELRALGVTHVIVATPTFLRFELFRPLPAAAAQFEMRKLFYQSLGAVRPTATLPGVVKVWELPTGGNIYLHPGMTVYDISAVPPAASPPPVKQEAVSSGLDQ